MLASEKISNAFLAIVEEAEKIKTASGTEDIQAGLRTIISIAKHQSDIRHAQEGTCTSPHTCSK